MSRFAPKAKYAKGTKMNNVWILGSLSLVVAFFLILAFNDMK